MKIIIMAVGKEKDFAGHELVAEYTARVAHYAPIEWIYIPASDKQEEEKRILKSLDNYAGGMHLVMLDERGKELTSQSLAEFIQTRLNDGLRTLVFLIGGSYGFGDAVRERAQTKLALSQLTFPHQFVRLLITEQIYRSFSILKGEKYHH